MGELLTPAHLMVVTVAAFVLFGAKRLPELGKGLGEAFRGFKDGIAGLAESTEQPQATSVAVKSVNSE